MGTLEKSGMVLEFRRAVVREEGAELWKLDVEIFGKDAFAPEDWLSLESYRRDRKRSARPPTERSGA